jgi:hypothetical protein
MTFVLVWVLISISDSGHSGRQVQYSPTVETLADCEKMQKSLTAREANAYQ